MYFSNGVPADSRLWCWSPTTPMFPSIPPHCRYSKNTRHMTLFVYPSAVSNASYAMTWDQLRELKSTGLFDFQSHTYWHPNLKGAGALAPAEFDKLVHMQLTKSREKLEKELGVKVDLLAWPFGIYDPWLMAKAAETGTPPPLRSSGIGHAARSAMALPRYLLTDSDRGKAFEAILNAANFIAKRERKDGKAIRSLVWVAVLTCIFPRPDFPRPSGRESDRSEYGQAVEAPRLSWTARRW